MAGVLQSAAVSSGRIRYWSSGADHADCLVVLHGLGADHQSVLTMAGLIRGFDIVAPDLPGFGLSDALRAPYTMEAYADVVEQLRIHLGRERIHLAGHSLGANVALVYGARHGAALESLCLLNPVWPAPGITTALARLYYGIGIRLPQPLDRLWLASRTAVYIGDALTFTTPDRAARRAILERDYVNIERVDLRAIKETYLSYLTTPWEAYAARIAVRTLIVTGSLDAVARPKTMKHLGVRIARATTAVVPDAGHLLPTEFPVHTGVLINGFLGNPAPSPGLAPR